METTANKNAATLVHLSAFAQYIFPLGNFILPVVIWSSLKSKSAFLERHGRSIINFELSLLLYCIIAAFIGIPILLYSLFSEVSANDFFNGNVHFSTDMTLADFSGLPLIAIIMVVLYGLMKTAEFFLVVFAAVKASNGEDYQYPLTVNFIKEQQAEPTIQEPVSSGE